MLGSVALAGGCAVAGPQSNAPTAAAPTLSTPAAPAPSATAEPIVLAPQPSATATPAEPPAPSAVVDAEPVPDSVTHASEGPPRVYAPSGTIKIHDEPDRDALPADFELPAGALLHRGTGCRACRNTGYHGRAGLFELMVMNDAVREGIMTSAPASQVIAAARANGLRLLREDGWQKVRDGVTTVEEVIRNTAI